MAVTPGLLWEGSGLVKLVKTAPYSRKKGEILTSA